MKELVVLSGKGGTGKTSVVSSFAALSDGAVFADCDVDAADLHIILEPAIRDEGVFSGGKLASVRAAECTGCGLCTDLCAFGAISQTGPAPTAVVDPLACEGCGVCAHFCPVGAIDFAPVENGRWYVSDTRFGPLAHAKLGIAEENSGKLAALVREKARALARERGRETMITDGPPGVGCPVISSVTGADLILVVTEPTRSGLHDLDRVLDLAAHFDIPALVAVNKADLNSELAAEIERLAGEDRLVGRIPYDRAVTDAQVEKKAVVEFNAAGDDAPGRDAPEGATSAAAEIRRLWEVVAARLDAS
ncbi:MAG: ATP-binding protein [Spirochaetaceae bacterium]